MGSQKIYERLTPPKPLAWWLIWTASELFLHMAVELFLLYNKSRGWHRGWHKKEGGTFPDTGLPLGDPKK